MRRSSRDPLVIVLTTVNFPHAPTRFPAIVLYTAAIYHLFLLSCATAGFYRETRYSFRIPPGEQLACPPWCLFSVCFSFGVCYPRFHHFLLPARKTPFAEDPVNREFVVVSDNGTTRLFFSLFSSSLLFACCLWKTSCSLQTTAKAMPYPILST